MSENSKLNVLWLTNLPAPYRFPIWDHMAKSVNLTVYFLLKEKNWRNWPAPEGRKWQHRFLSFNSLRIGEYDLVPSFRGARRMLNGIDFVIVGGWESPMFVRTILLAKRKKIPIIQFYESFSESHRFKRGVIPLTRNWILNKPDRYISISAQSTETLKKMGIAENRILTLFNPVDVSWYNEYAERHRKPAVTGHRFLYVGQLIERKNVASVIEAFAAMREPADTLTIAGEGSLKESLVDLAQKLRISETVKFVGHKTKEEIASLYTISNTLVLASLNEVWGLVVNEALASGMQVVISENLGVTQFVRNMEGVYSCQNQMESIQEALVKSQNDWKGFIEKPEILQFTPQYFAVSLLKDLEMKIPKKMGAKILLS